MNAVATTFLKDYTSPVFLIEAVDLSFVLDEGVTQVCAYLTVSRHTNNKVKSPLILDGEELELVSIKLDDSFLTSNDYQVDESKLTIPNVPNKFTLTIRTKIKPLENTSLNGLYVSRGIFCTQCEAEGFRRITYFIDRPDILARYTTTIIADKVRYPVLLSNGNKTSVQELEKNLHSVTWEDPFKKPSYLFALVAGDLEVIQDTFITKSNRNVNLQIFFEKGQKEKCFHAMDSLKKAMRWDEKTYGREYDLDIFMIAVIDDFNMGAMENKGLNIFNAQTILADPETATDIDYNYVTKVVGHEYFHNWTGNRITCRDWFQLSLKEGLTVFREQEFSESLGAPVIERINTVKQLRSLQFAEDAGPLAHPVQPSSYIEINNFYTTTIYEKGAELIRMMKLLVGVERFREGMDLYFNRYDGQAVTIENFIHSIEEASGYDLQQFRLWYKQSGTPELNIKYCYNPKLKTFDLTVKQSCPSTPNQPTKQPFCIPLAMGLINNQGYPVLLQLEGEAKGMEKQRIVTITQSEQKFRFINVSTKPLPSLLRNFSAPVKLFVDYTDEDLSFLMQKDSDGFNRWNAMQQLVTRIIMHRIAFPPGQSLASLTSLLKAYEVLMETTTDKALLAELLNLPNEAYFAEQMKIIDVDGIHRERNWLRERIANRLQKQLVIFYKTNQTSKPYFYSVQSQAQRRLKNTCLNYLMLTGNSNIHDLCVTQYLKADNMTDRISALSELINHNSSETERFLNDFYARWKNNSLVICKWLAVQARAPLANSLERVKKLLEHSAFDWKNPNKIRSLIGIYCTENHVQFHQITGEGYRFLREKIQYLDKLNPQIAARLLKCLTSWQRFDKIRQELMSAQLKIIAKTVGISSDVYEIVSKSLR